MSKKGFTMIELLGVFTILAVILLITIPSLTGLLKKQKENAYQKYLNDLYLAAEAYVQTSDAYEFQIPNQKVYVKIEELVTSKYLKNTIINPQTNEKVNLNHYIEITWNQDQTFHYAYLEEKPVEIPIYKELLLNGADPVLKGNLIPVVIESDATVKKADITQKWYQYENKEWANAVILKDESIIYENNEIIPEENIESYFVWIPKYSYQLWDMGEYSGLTSVNNSKTHSIAIHFGLENTTDTQEGECTTPRLAGESGNCKIGDYMTHPAFLSFHVNGFWVGKFQTGYEGATTKEEAEENRVDVSKVIIKPNVHSWTKISVGNMFQTSYEYQRELDSHMMKNTEWGAVAYLSHSIYGINGKIRLNNNSNIITGYSATEEATIWNMNGGSVEGNRYEGTEPGIDGSYTVNYRNPLSEVSSTTGNKTGIYDMSGSTLENVMGYTSVANIEGGASGITNQYPDFFTNANWSKYYDRYTSTLNTNYTNRILGDATGEMGPFELYKYGNYETYISSWYSTYSFSPYNTHPWVGRGGGYNSGKIGNIWVFSVNDGAAGGPTFRIVLAP